jgi:hypothetical protein
MEVYHLKMFSKFCDEALSSKILPFLIFCGFESSLQLQQVLYLHGLFLWITGTSKIKVRKNFHGFRVQEMTQIGQHCW